MAESSELGAKLWETFRAQLRESWQRGERLGVETLLAQQEVTQIDDETLLGLVLSEFRLRRELGETPDADEYARRFPQHAERLNRLLAMDKALGTIGETSDAGPAIGPTLSSPSSLTASNAGSSDQPTVITPNPLLSLQSPNGTSGASMPEAVSPGQKLGPYELLEKLGQGGMGAVYKARQTRLNKLVAIKVLPPQFVNNPQAMARFDREMQAVGKVEHPNIVRAMDADEHSGIHFLAMEYVEGSDLERLVREQGPRSVAAAADAVRQAALGLAEAHELGLVHRDIKPSNLLRTAKGQVKVLDLGLASLSQDDSAGVGEGLTGTGQVLGTPDYMAPEQWEDTHSVDGRADQYALGCTLFYLLMGHAPYSDDRHRSVISKMNAHVNEPPPEIVLRPIAIPIELTAIYRRLMAKSRAERYESAAELADALVPFIECVGSGSVVQGLRTQGKAVSGLSSPDFTPASRQTQPAISVQSGSAVDSRVGRRRKYLALAAAGALATLLVAGIFKNTTKDSTPTEIILPEGSKVTISESPIEGQQSNATNSAGRHSWPADAPKPAIAPFDAEYAKHKQEEWADFLKLPVEFTNAIDMTFRLIPPGEYERGSSPPSVERYRPLFPENKYWQSAMNQETPQHHVVLTQPFYISVFETRQADYARVIGENPSYFCAAGKGAAVVAGLDTSRFPVEHVSWNDAADFCEQLAILEGLSPFYRREGDRADLLGESDIPCRPRPSGNSHAARAAKGTTVSATMLPNCRRWPGSIRTRASAHMRLVNSCRTRLVSMTCWATSSSGATMVINHPCTTCMSRKTLSILSCHRTTWSVCCEKGAVGPSQTIRPGVAAAFERTPMPPIGRPAMASVQCFASMP